MRSKNSDPSSPIRENSYNSPKNSDKWRKCALAPCSINRMSDFMNFVTHDAAPTSSFTLPLSSSVSIFKYNWWCVDLKCHKLVLRCFFNANLYEPQTLNDMDDEPLEHLATDLTRTLDQYLYGPPRFVRHVPQKPFARLLAGIELFGEQLHPQHHCWLKHKRQASASVWREGPLIAYLFLGMNERFDEKWNRKLSGDARYIGQHV